MTPATPNEPIDPRVRIGLAHMKVGDLERSLRHTAFRYGFARD